MAKRKMRNEDILTQIKNTQKNVALICPDPKLEAELNGIQLRAYYFEMGKLEGLKMVYGQDGL